MFDLDARIDLDEVVAAAIHVHQELDRAGMGVADLATEFQRGFAQLRARGVVEVGCRGALDHLLVAALHRAVALEQVDQLAVRVAQHLHLDMAGAAHQLFEVHLVVAERGQRLAPAGGQLFVELGFRFDDSHATSAAAPAGLQHQRIADGQRLAPRLGGIDGQGVGRRHHWHARGHGRHASRYLVSQRAHHLRFRPDEGDAGRGAGIGEVRIFRQEAIAGMDGIDLGFLGHAQYVVDVEIGGDGLLAFAD